MTTVDKIKSLIEQRDNGVDCQAEIDVLFASIDYDAPSLAGQAHAEKVESLY